MSEVGEFLYKMRRAKDLGIRELCRKIEMHKAAGSKVSPSYYSQVETGNGCNPERITMDFFWAVSTVLGTDPLQLFVLSRPAIPKEFAAAKERKRLFSGHEE